MLCVHCSSRPNRGSLLRKARRTRPPPARHTPLVCSSRERSPAYPGVATPAPSPVSDPDPEIQNPDPPSARPPPPSSTHHPCTLTLTIVPHHDHGCLLLPPPLPFPLLRPINYCISRSPKSPSSIGILRLTERQSNQAQ